MVIYLNNAATSWPKPESVGWNMSDFISYGGANHARGSTSPRDMETMSLVLLCREKIAELFKGHEGADSRYVTFTSNITESLNIVIKGFVRPGMRILTSSMEHNSVIRPLREMEHLGARVDVLPCDATGYLREKTFEEALQTPVDLFVLSHASNVSGTLQNLPFFAEMCAREKIPLVLDSAQTAGDIPINTAELQLAALCFTGHKGLLGPQGIGGVVWHPEFASRCTPLMTGGTGSFSHEKDHPTAMPDKFEAGTPNLPGLAGLLAALEWIDSQGLEKIHAKKNYLTQMLLEGLHNLQGIEFYGPDTETPRMSVVSINIDGMDNATAAQQLSSNWGIETRPGLHCSPLAHQTLGTYPQGTLRLSPGFFNTEEEIEHAVSGIGVLSRSASDHFF